MHEDFPPQFMNYSVRWNAGAGKFDKLPCRPNGLTADAHAPVNWMSYDDALQNATFDNNNPDQPFGVAFVLTEHDPYFFLDLDKCLDINNQWTHEAQAIFNSFTGAMGEVSISGTGLHVIGKCEPSMLQDRKNKWDGWLEFYTQKRFIALGTGGFNPIGGQLDMGIDWTQQLLKTIPQRQTLGELPQGIDPKYTGLTDDVQLIQKMLASTGGVGAAFGGKATVKQLWEADPVLNQIYPAYDGNQTTFDHSSADAALFAHLAFWTGKDMPRMERLFRKSALMRDKFDKREDYRLKTIQDAARMCNRVYDYITPQKLPSAIPAPEVYLTIPEQIEYFDGCVYILEQHKVLLPNGSLVKPEQFKSFYGGHEFQMAPDATKPTKNAYEAFTENRAHVFPKVTRGVFDPNQPTGMLNSDEVNIYSPAVVECVQGDVSPFMDYFSKLIPVESDREIILAWMSSVVQNPGIKFQWAVVLQGAEGNGKTFIMNCVAEAVGNIHTHRPNAEQIGEKYNSYLETSLFVLVEEIHMQGRREMLDGLKDKITNEWIEIRGMAQDKRMVKSFSKWGFCTNHMDAVIKSQNDRRYSIFFTAQQSYADILRDGLGGSYFPELYKWARAGGYAAMTHFLKNYEIPAHLDPAGDCHRAPDTSSTSTAIKMSIGIVEREIEEATQDGTQGMRGGFISSYVLDRLLRERGLRISLNKRAEILEAMGYIRCAVFSDGRFPRAIFEEGNKRPIIYCKDVVFSDNAMKQYYDAQGYITAEQPLK